MAPKMRAEVQKAYRERKLQHEGVTKTKTKKTRAEDPKAVQKKWTSSGQEPESELARELLWRIRK